MSNSQKTKARRLKRFHLVAMVFWVMNIPPFIWAFVTMPRKDFEIFTLIYIGVVSIYANFVGHFAGYEGARAEEAAGG